MASVDTGRDGRIRSRPAWLDDTQWAFRVVVCLVAVALIVVSARENQAILDRVFAIGAVLVLAMCAMIDAYTRTIPNRIIYPALVVTLLVTLAHQERSLMSALVAAIVAASPFMIAFWFLPRRIRRTSGLPSQQEKSGVSHVGWAGLAGATTMLVAGLAQPDQSATSAIVTALIVGAAFSSLMLSDNSRHSLQRAPGQSSSPTRAMGGGDVKLAALLGLLAGVPAVFAVLTVVVLGGAVAAATIIVMQRDTPGGGVLPYGPFLAGGAVLGML